MVSFPAIDLLVNTKRSGLFEPDATRRFKPLVDAVVKQSLFPSKLMTASHFTRSQESASNRDWQRRAGSQTE